MYVRMHVRLYCGCYLDMISQSINQSIRKFKKKSIFKGKFAKNFNFFQVILCKISIFHGKFPKKYRFSRQKLAIYSYFWANYSISLQKSPLSNILPDSPVHDIIIFYDPSTTPCSKSGGRDPQPPRIDAYESTESSFIRKVFVH